MIKEMNTTSVYEAMEVGDHNYTVEMKPLILPDGKEVWDKKAVVRSDNGKYLGTVGKDYQPVQPIRIYEMVNTMLNATDGAITAVLDLHGGSVFGVSLKLATSEYLPGDPVDLNFLLLAAHNGMYGILGRALSRRISCLNQVPSSTKLFNLKHTRFVDNRLDVATKMLSYYDKEIKQFDSSMRQLVEYKMNPTLTKEFIHRLYPEPDKQETNRSKSIRGNQIASFINLLDNGRGMDVPGLSGTGWHAFNALSEYVNHERTTRVKDGRDEAEVRFEAINFGSGNDLMQRGLGILLEMSQSHHELTNQPVVY
jgi:phage/plasmid-like protein (TIGR03299 family)